MIRRCVHTCERKNFYKGESTGWRSTIYYPGGGSYKGAWLHTQHHRYGVKITAKGNLTYEGQWQNGKRHGIGTLCRTLADGSEVRVYVGEWENDKKSGEGKQFSDDGIYYGFWTNNQRHGLGIKWYKDGGVYLGEWAVGVPHGLGVQFYVNGNRYEGHFARGYKNGEGTFFHMHTGQVQKGMWDDGMCRTSMMQDEFRNQGDTPTEYPLPKTGLAEPHRLVRRLFKKYMDNAKKPMISVLELIALNYARKVKEYTKLEPKAKSDSKIKHDDMTFACVCKKTPISIAAI